MPPSTAAAGVLDRPPGFRFQPKDKELVRFYLLPRARGLQDLFPGADIIEDNTAGSTLPWKLFKRHNLDDDDKPYFFVRTKAGARPDRLCDGGFKWKPQRPLPGDLRAGGERIRWSKNSLSLVFAGGGSTGWVMHEYTVTQLPCPSTKICQIAFTGHGRKRKRVPDGYDDGDACEGEPESQRTRVAAAATTAAAPPWGSATARAFGQETEQVSGAMDQLDRDYAAEIVAELDDAECYLESFEEKLPMAEPEQQVEDVVPPPPRPPTVQESGTAEQLYGYQRCCGVPDGGELAAGTLGGVAWGGFYFC